jgi:hypothetical protein
MDEQPLCGVCHVQVRGTDYFCFNCGANLRTKPESFGAPMVGKIFAGAFLVPPMGIIWGIRFLRSSDPSVKTAGAVSVLLTSAVLIWLTLTSISLVNTINAQVNSQIQNIQGF